MENEEKCFDAVISGISGKFPSSDDLEELKEKLLQKQYLVTEENCRWNKEKWKIPSATGKINVVKKFDDTFFGIHSGIAATMDPLTRVCIERAYEAIMDAGINPKCLKNSKTAVYTASCISDSESVGCDEKLTTRFWLIAHVRALLANRISYVLNFKGPSWTIDSTWIGGIECLRQAVSDIEKGRIENVLIGVTNLILFPSISERWMGLEKLSSDGSCYPFEEQANGYGRSESVVFLFLQRANEAKRIYATISKTDAIFCADEALNLLKPKEEAFVKFFKKFYSKCEIPTKEIFYLEADGSANKYLDEIELNSVGRVLCNEERGDNPLYVGTVKSNLGHSEGAASLVSIAKALISLDSGIIPPNKNFRKLNENIEKLKSNEMKIVTDPIALPDGKYVAVNTIGLCTSIGHVLLKQNPKQKKVSNESQCIPRLVLLTSRYETGIFNMINKVESMPYNEEYFNLLNDIFKENTKDHFYRGYTILGSAEKKIHFTLETGTPLKRPIWFVFAGMGTQWPGMGADLMKIPIFAETIRELDTYLSPLGIDIKDIITNYDPTSLKNIVNSFVGIAAMQICFVDILNAIGIKPDGMFGHSLGENGCAYADGCFTKYQAIMAAYFRGLSSSKFPTRKGLMAAVGVRYDKLTNLPENVQIACHNSNDNTTISGVYEDVERYIEQLKQQDIFAKIVNSNYVAYHSKEIKPLAPFILENIRKIVPNPKTRSSRWLSTSIPEHNWNSPLAKTSSAEYHVNNFSGTVYFAEVCSHVPEDAVVIEISAHGIFQNILKRMLPESCVVIPLGKRETSSSMNFLLSSIGKLHVVGLTVDINAIYPPIEYPVSRGVPSIASMAAWNYETEWEVNLCHTENKIEPLTISLKDKKWRFLTGYKINEKIIVPFSLLLFETLQAYERKDPILIFEYVNIPKYAEIFADKETTVNTLVQYGSGNFEIVEECEILMNGILRYSQENIVPTNYEYVNLDDCILFSNSEICEVFKQYSMEFSDQLCNISRIYITPKGLQAQIIWNGDLAIFINSIPHLKLFYELCIYNKGPLYPSSFLKLSIKVEKYNTMQNGVAVNIVYDKHTNVFSGPEIELIGLESTYEYPFLKNLELQFQNVQFVPHDQPRTENIHNFLTLCGQIVGETCNVGLNDEKNDELLHFAMLIEDELNNTTDFKTVSLPLFIAIYQELRETQIDVNYVNKEDMKNIQKNGSKYRRYFIVCNSVESFYKDVSYLANNVEDLFLLTFNQLTKIGDNFVEITKEKFENYNVILWKKKIAFTEKIIKIEPFANEHWLEDLEEKFSSFSFQKSVIIQWYSDYIIDLMDIKNEINSINRCHSIRYVLIMDKEKIENLQDNATFYKNQLEKGLVMNVYKNGEWGSVRNLKLKYNTSISNLEKFTLKSKTFNNVDVEYVTLNTALNDEELEKGEIDYFEFSGIYDKQKRIMGIANIDEESDETKLTFQWSVPEQWSLEDAVTVPLAYVKIYYTLLMKGQLSNNSKVLVHSGYTILGEAAIAVALSMKCKVYTSVTNTQQMKFIAERFRESSQLVILNSEFHEIDLEILKLTKQKGVDIIINANTGKQLQQSLSCLHKYGSILQFSEYSDLKQEKIGLQSFLKNTSFYSIADRMILNSEQNIKIKIQNLVFDGIQKGVILPFRRVVYNIEEEKSLNKFFSENKNYNKILIRQKNCVNLENNKFLCDPEKSYLIIGHPCEIWFNIVMLLIKNYARKLIFVDPEINENYSNQYKKRFDIFIRNKTNLSLMHLSSNVANCANESLNMIEIANNYAELDVVFCISLNAEQIKNIDCGLRKNAHNLQQFVCLQSDVSNVCESRHRSMLPVLNIIYERSITNSAVLMENIKMIIHNMLKINSPFLYLTDISQYTNKFKTNLVQNRISHFLPTYSENEHLTNSFSSNADFEKVCSKCPHYCTRMQLFPIFILPGLHWFRLRKLIRKLMYPVFCAKIPLKYSSAVQVAQSLIKPLKRIQPQGPYTIIGESWSGPIAIELTKLLEEHDSIKLILLEGMPTDLRNKLSSLGKFESRNFVENICKICFKNEQTEENGTVEITEKKFGKDKATFLELLQKKLIITHRYSPNNVYIRNKVISIKLTDASVLNTHVDFEEHYGQELDLKILNEEHYDNLINSDITATIINDNALFKW